MRTTMHVHTVTRMREGVRVRELAEHGQKPRQGCMTVKLDALDRHQ